MVVHMCLYTESGSDVTGSVTQGNARAMDGHHVYRYYEDDNLSG